MSADGHEVELCAVGLDEAKEELERILSDPRFHATARAKRMLRYIAERCFEGESNGVKAYAIAIDVLGRPERFDTNADPIVRIEMSRLRNALSNYYEAYGNELDVVVHLPVGRYLAVFTSSVAISRPAIAEMNKSGEPCGHPEDASLIGGSAAWPKQYLGIGASILALAVAGSAAGAYFTSGPSMTSRPTVSVSVTAAEDSRATEADDAGRYLVAAMSRFRTLDMTEGTASSLNTTGKADYEIEMKYYADDDDRTIWWQVIDGEDRGILRSGIDRVQIDGRSEITVRDELVATLAKRFASTRGVISNLEAHEDPTAITLGNACVLRGEIALDEGGRIGIAQVRSCLEGTLARQPNNSDVMSVLSRVVVASTGADPDNTDFDKATTLANRAVLVDPGSDRAYVALMMVNFYSGKTEAAIAAGNKALEINPHNPDVLAKLAGVLQSAGFESAAVSLAKDATENVEAVPRDARIVLALDAYSRGDWSNASLVSEQINCSDFVVRAIRAAALGQMGSPDARRSLEYLHELLPDYRTSLPKWMARRQYRNEVITGLQAGLFRAEKVGEKLALVAQ